MRTFDRMSLLAAFLALQVTPSVLVAQQNTAGTDARIFQDLSYRSAGPSRGGRATAVAGVPSQSGTFYFGATGGGVWKTADYGDSWTNVSDGFFGTGSVGAIAVAPANPDRVYVGTGSDGIRSNVIRGNGVYRSDDGGQSWRHMGLPRAGLIGAVLVHPSNPDLVYAAAIGQPFGRNPERGVYRSANGGGTWERVLFVSDSTGAVDLEFAPDDPRTIYASLWRTERKPWTIISGAREGGVYRSGDGGDHWTRLGGGLPSGLVGKSDLAVSASDPNRLYVLIEAAPGGGLYRSDDRGATFRLVSTQNGLLDRPFYYTNVDADPTDADVVYVSATEFWKSNDGGKTFQRRPTPHGDNHDLWIHPANGRVMIQSNDGGANVTRDGGGTWSTQYNQPTAELYQVALDTRYPYWLYAGQQDNGTAIMVPSLPPYPSPVGPIGYWRIAGGCETGPAVPKPGDPEIVYANCKGQFSRYNARTGQDQNYWVGAETLYGANPKDLQNRFQRVVPIAVSPHETNTVYHASQYLHRTRDEGITWERISPDLTANDPARQVISGAPITRDITGEEYYSTIYSVAESPVEPGVIWVGANDGPVSVTRDAGVTWARITPAGLPPGGRVQTVAPSSRRPGKAFVSVLRYQLDDWKPYVYRTRNYGTSWTKITDGIPDDVPVRVVREDPLREGLLYAGTDGGMFISFDDGDHWQPFQLNLPATPVTDIAFSQSDLVLSTMGRGFWILDDRLFLTDPAAGPMLAPGPHLFTPAQAIRTRYRYTAAAGTDPAYPPPGVWLDYSLPREFTGPLTIVIRDANGRAVRRFSSDSVAHLGEDLLGAATPRLPTTPGHHRVRWDFSLPGPWDASPARRGRGGPLAMPGSYTVMLTADFLGGGTVQAPLGVVPDPRVSADGVSNADLREQFVLTSKVSDLLSRARRLTERVKAHRAERPNDPALAAAEQELVTPAITYPRAGMVDQIAYLYGMITAADQRPGRDAEVRYDQLRSGLDRVERSVAGSGLPRLPPARE